MNMNRYFMYWTRIEELEFVSFDNEPDFIKYSTEVIEHWGDDPYFEYRIFKGVELEMVPIKAVQWSVKEKPNG